MSCLKVIFLLFTSLLAVNSFATIQPLTLADLPDELLVEIGTKSDPRGVASLAQSARRFRHLPGEMMADGKLTLRESMEDQFLPKNGITAGVWHTCAFT